MNIRVDYEQLEAMAKGFNQQADYTDSMYGVLVGKVEDLRAGGWIGEGANAFYVEMDELVLPAVNTFTDALYETHVVLMQVLRLFQEMEDDAASYFAIDDATAVTLHNLNSFIFGGIDILSFLSKGFKNADVLPGPWDIGLSLFSGFLDGTIDLASGEEGDIFNAYGKNFMSAGIDLGISALVGVPIPVVSLVTLATEGESWLGGVGINISRGVNDFLQLDPRVQEELDRGLDYDERVFQGLGEFNDTWDGIKSMAWDVIARPMANDMQASIEHAVRGIKTGEPGEFLKSAQHMVEATLSNPVISPLGSAVNFFTDADAQQHFSDNLSSTIEHGWNYALGAAQAQDAVTRMPMRLGVSVFNGMVNTIPMSDGLRDSLNNISLEAAEAINRTPVYKNYFGMPDLSIWDLPKTIFQ